ncbi:hypothetical protein D915_005723 [Fasciola hepatica]|uniref:Ndr family protein n=1 Tax=Fasciola hepatica TaxID=6192 RepID=A0A4E0RBP0_FASHE|nr:hypothetical protein D915_005723 [Fasciola hepatica]
MEIISVCTERCGTFTVYVQGVLPKNAPVILTVPDLGCDHSYYAQFVNTYIPGRFCWCHIELPGQSYDATEWALGGASGDLAVEPQPDLGARKSESAGSGETGQLKPGKGPIYPTMQELAVGVRTVLEKLEIAQVVLFAEGSGANLLSRVAILCDERILGAMLIHGRCTQSGPLQLLRDKLRNWKSNNLEPATEKYLLEHRFATVNTAGMSESLKAEFVRYRQMLAERVNIKNLNLLTYTYAHRSSLADMIQGLKCPMLLISGTLSAHRSGVRYMFELMNKARKDEPKSRTSLELIEIDDTTTPLVEKPEKVAESALLFLQGLGIVTSTKPISGPNTRKSSTDPTTSMSSPEKRSCSEFINLDSASTVSSEMIKSPVRTEAEPGDVVKQHTYPVSSRFLNRQLSMAELDLPRGPDALSTVKIIHSTDTNSPRKFSQSSAMEQRLSDSAE